MTNLILMLVEQGCGRIKRVDRTIDLHAISSLSKSDRGRILDQEVAMLQARLNSTAGTCHVPKDTTATTTLHD